MSEFYKVTIQSIKKVTKNCVIIGFNIPRDLQELFAFKAGQYITIKTTINGDELRRDYSLCTSPDSNLYSVAVKEVENGLFSKFANTELKENDIIEISAPRGRFIFEPEASNEKTIVAFAAGSGITPIMSIIRTALENEHTSKVVLVYGNKSTEGSIFYEALLELQKTYVERFFIHFVYSQSQEEDALFGRIDTSTVNYILKNKYKNDAFKAFYLCGPSDMITTVSETLKTNDIRENSIFFELFTPVETKVPLNTEIIDGDCSITILVDDEETTFTMSAKKTILEAALDNDIDAPYSCQGGICSSCIAKVTKGSSKMRQNNILTDQEVNDGLVLTCQAIPSSNTIYIDYDNV